MRYIERVLKARRAFLYLIAGAVAVSLAVVGCGGGGYGGGSGMGAAVLPPQAFSLTMPANNAAGVGTTPLLTWSASLYATGYTVHVSTTSDFAVKVVNVTVTTTSYTVSPALAPGTYFWRVRASNLYGVMTAGPFSFTT